MYVNQPKSINSKYNLPGRLIKCILLLVVCTVLFNNTNAQTKDTTYTYYRYGNGNLNVLDKVSTADSADLIRVIYPADPVAKLMPVKQFYSDGKVDFVGTYDFEYYNKNNLYRLTGDFISFYHNG